MLASPANIQSGPAESQEQLMLRAISASEAGDKETAYALFQRVTLLYPSVVEAWVWLGWSSPDLEASEAAFRRAQQLAPDNQEAGLGLRWVASQRADQPSRPAPAPAPSQTTQAMPVQSSAAASSDTSPRPGQILDADTVLQQAITATKRGDKEGAYRLFEHVASLRSSDPDVWVWLGGTSPDLDDAERMFTRAYELDPENKKALLGLRWVVLRRQMQPAMAGAGALDGVMSMPAPEPEPEMATVGASSADQGQSKEGFLSRFFKRFGKASS